MTLYLQDGTPLEEEDDDVLNNVFETERMCPCCQEYIVYTDEVFILEVIEAAQDGGSILTQPLLDVDGDYEFEPYILHLMCWEEVLEQIREATQDQPPVECANGILLCSCCKSTIAAFEPFISARLAEIHVSRRCPSGNPTDTIETYGSLDPVCLACIVFVFEDHFEDWDDLFSDFNLGMDEEDGID